MCWKREAAGNEKAKLLFHRALHLKVECRYLFGALECRVLGLINAQLQHDRLPQV